MKLVAGAIPVLPVQKCRYIARMNQERKPRIVVMTGATGGFGAHALEHLAAEGDTRVIIGARGGDRELPSEVQSLPLDLASFASIRQFVSALVEHLAGEPIDILILNAGMHLPSNSRRSADGFEMTFAVNHLGHYLLSRLLVPCLVEGARVVITTSDTHDPAITGMAPKFLDLQEWAHPSAGGFGTGMRAYAASKLCNLMTAQSLARFDVILNRNIEVIAFNPGLTAGSAGRDAPATMRVAMRLLMHTVFPLVSLIRPEFRMNKPEHSGGKLAAVALGEIVLPPGRVYISLIRGRPAFPDPSKLARNREAQDELWRESAIMVGLE